MKDWNEVKESKVQYVQPQSKICPMISNIEQAAECVHDACAWFDSKYGRCSIFSLACKK